MKVFFIYNPVAGVQVANELSRIEEALSRAHHRYDIFETTLEKGPIDLLNNFDSTYDAILASGGDGTISDTVQGMHKHNIEVPLQILPSGTTNDFAYNFIRDTDFESQLQNLFKGSVQSFDIGLSGDKQTISYALSFGNFTELTYKTPQKLKNYLGYKAYILFGFLSFRKIHSYSVSVKSDAMSFQDSLVFGSVTNTYRLGNIVEFDSENVEFDDGLFEVFLIRKPRSVKQLRTILLGLRTKHYEDDLFVQFKTDRIVIESKKEIEWNHDGEYGGSSRIKEFKVLKRNLNVYV